MDNKNTEDNKNADFILFPNRFREKILLGYALSPQRSGHPSA